MRTITLGGMLLFAALVPGQTFTITEVSISEPEAQLFDLPKCFTVVDHRGKAPEAGH